MDEITIEVVRKYHHPSSIYIGRGSIYGNPFDVATYGRGKCIDMYKDYFYERICKDIDFYNAMVKLGRYCVYRKYVKLGCFCAPNPCHGNVIKDWLLKNLDVFREENDTAQTTKKKMDKIELKKEHRLTKQNLKNLMFTLLNKIEFPLNENNNYNNKKEV